MTWWVLCVEPQREAAANAKLVLASQGDDLQVRPYLPFDASCKRARPLFPGYLLAEFAAEDCWKVAQTVHVTRILGAITQEEFERVKAVEAEGAQQAQAECAKGAAVIATVMGREVRGRVAEQRGSRVRVICDVLSQCSLWVERRNVRLAKSASAAMAGR